MNKNKKQNKKTYTNFDGEIHGKGKPENYKRDFLFDSDVLNETLLITGVQKHDEYENDYGNITKQFILFAKRDGQEVKIMTNHAFVYGIIRHLQEKGTPLNVKIMKYETKKGKTRYFLETP